MGLSESETGKPAVYGITYGIMLVLRIASAYSQSFKDYGVRQC